MNDPLESPALHDLRWSMTRTVGSGDEKHEERFDFDLTPLAPGYAPPFLQALKAALIKRRNRVSLKSIDTEYQNLKRGLLKVQLSTNSAKSVRQIDLPFLVELETIKEKLNPSELGSLKRFFSVNRSEETLFASELQVEDFPTAKSAVGARGEAIKRILAQAMSRATMAHILTAIEEAYENGQIDIGHYSFSRLAFHVYSRPASYRRLRAMDLSRDEDDTTGAVTWFLDILPPKTQADNPQRLAIKLHPDVGELLKLQQAHVVQRYGHLVANADLGKVALFPARLLTADSSSWQSEHANQHHGMCKDSTAFSRAYLRPLEHIARRELSFNALRHTVGTQLALAGLSASSIAAVLRHANDVTCQRYVDLFFAGTLDRISDAMQSSFDEHFPVYKDVLSRTVSKSDPIPKEKAIYSEDIITGRRELTAECGRHSLCGYAPLACYDCHRFRPCWDADHTINLDVVNREIAEFEGQGLAMQHEVRKYKQLRNSIRVVISICELKAKTTSKGTSP